MWPCRPHGKSDVRNWEQEILDRFESAGVPSRLAFHLTAVNIDGVVFFFSQGEPFVEYQLEARAAFPGDDLLRGIHQRAELLPPSAHAFDHRRGYEYEIDQMHIYIKAPYPLSDRMPASYAQAVRGDDRKSTRRINRT